MPSLRNLPDAFGIITCRTGTGWNVRVMATEPGYRMAILTQGAAGAK